MADKKKKDTQPVPDMVTILNRYVEIHRQNQLNKQQFGDGEKA